MDAEPIEIWGTGEAVSISYSSDGSLMAVGTVAGSVLIYETENYNLIQTFKTELILGYYDSIHNRYRAKGGIAISPDNHFIGAVAVDGSIGLWDIESGKNEQFIRGEEEGVPSADYSSKSVYFLGKGEIFVSLFSYNNVSSHYRFFRVEDFTEIDIQNNLLFERNNTKDLRSVNGYIGGSSRSCSYNRTIDWINWIEVRPVGRYCRNLLISDNGNYTLRRGAHENNVVYDNNTDLKVLDIPVPTEWKGFTPTQLTVFDSISSFDSTEELLIISFPFDQGQIYLTTIWRLMDGEKVSEFTIPSHASEIIIINQEKDQLAYPVAGGVEIIRLPSGEVARTLLFNSCAGTIKLSPDGQLIGSFLSHAIYICHASDGELLRSINVPTGSVTDISWSSDSKSIVSSGETEVKYDTKIHIWDIETGALVNTFDGHMGNVLTVNYSPDGLLIASTAFQTPRSFSNACFTGTSTREIIVRQASDGKVILNLTPIQKFIEQIDFSRDGSKLIILERTSCSWDYATNYWDDATVYLVDLKSRATIVPDAAGFQLLPSGHLLSSDGKVWNIDGEIPELLNTTSYSFWPSWPSYISSDGKMAVSVEFNSDSYPQIIRDVFLVTFGENKSVTAFEAKQTLLHDEGKYLPSYITAAFINNDNKVIIAPFELAGVIKVFSTTSFR
jgi:WD40 repeat protein